MCLIQREKICRQERVKISVGGLETQKHQDLRGTVGRRFHRGLLGMEDHRCRNTSGEGMTESRPDTLVILYLPYTEVSDPVFSVTLKTEQEKQRERT